MRKVIRFLLLASKTFLGRIEAAPGTLVKLAGFAVEPAARIELKAAAIRPHPADPIVAAEATDSRSRGAVFVRAHTDISLTPERSAAQLCRHGIDILIQSHFLLGDHRYVVCRSSYLTAP
jgi:hypothetical protein